MSNFSINRQMSQDPDKLLAEYENFAKSQMDAEKIQGDKKLSADDAQKSTGGKAIAQFTAGGVMRSVEKDKNGNSDKVRYTKRGDNLQANNNETRGRFLDAVIKHYGSWAAVPNKVRKELEMKNFSVLGGEKELENKYSGENTYDAGSDNRWTTLSTTGKPLTARRITKVINAMKAAALEEANKKISAAKIHGGSSFGPIGSYTSEIIGRIIDKKKIANDPSAQNLVLTDKPTGHKTLMTFEVLEKHKGQLICGLYDKRVEELEKLLNVRGIDTELQKFFTDMIGDHLGKNSGFKLNQTSLAYIKDAAKQIALLTRDSQINCQEIGHPLLGDSVKTVYGKLHAALMSISSNVIRYGIKDELNKKVQMFIESLLKGVCDFDIKQVQKGNSWSEVAKSMANASKQQVLKDIGKLGVPQTREDSNVKVALREIREYRTKLNVDYKIGYPVLEKWRGVDDYDGIWSELIDSKNFTDGKMTDDFVNTLKAQYGLVDEDISVLAAAYRSANTNNLS